MNTALSEDAKNKLIKIAGYCAVITALIVIICKLLGWFITDSLSILSSCVDSVLDIAASLFNLVAIHFSMQPPDKEHRFGHQKVGDIAVLTQSILFCLSGVILMTLSIRKFFNPSPITQGSMGITIMLICTVVTLFLLLFQKYVISKTKSNIIKADHLHYLVDLLTNILTICSIFLSSYFDITIIDPIFAFIIAIYIFFGATKLLKQAFDNLTDREFPEEERQVIKQAIMSNAKVLGFHDLKTRFAGQKPFIQVHIELDGNLTLYESHDIICQVEASILKIIPEAEIIIHQDPAGVSESIDYKD